MEKFKYLGVTFSSDGRQDNKLNTRIGKASAVMHQLYQSVALKQELCTKAKLSVFRSVFALILRDAKYKRPKWIFCKKSEVYPYLTRLKALTLINFSALNRYYFTSNNRYCVWPCDMNVPQVNGKATNGCSSKWQKA